MLRLGISTRGIKRQNSEKPQKILLIDEGLKKLRS